MKKCQPRLSPNGKFYIHAADCQEAIANGWTREPVDGTQSHELAELLSQQTAPWRSKRATNREKSTVDIDRLTLVKLIGALQECEEYFGNRADCETLSESGHNPNPEMRLLCSIREVLDIVSPKL